MRMCLKLEVRQGVGAFIATDYVPGNTDRKTQAGLDANSKSRTLGQ